LTWPTLSLQTPPGMRLSPGQQLRPTFPWLNPCNATLETAMPLLPP
jgi:hypothetical protein